MYVKPVLKVGLNFPDACFGSCDIVKISLVITVELYTLALFGVKFIAMPLEPKLAIYWQKTRFWARIAIFGWLSRFGPFVSTPS